MAAGQTVRILVGRQRGKRGEVVRVEGRHVVVRFAGLTASYLPHELESV